MANRSKLVDAMLDNDQHTKRVESAKEAEQARHEKQKLETRARIKANKNTAFGKLPAEEKGKYTELLQIVPNGRGWTAYQRIDAIFAYFVTGYIREAARLCSIPEGTLLSWAQSSWWKSAMQKVKDLKQDELDVQYTQIIDKAIVELNDRLDLGDERLDKEGMPVRVKVGAKDLMLINAMAFDKRALLRRDPTNISEKVITVEDRNTILAEQFRKIARPILEGEVSDQEENDGNV